MCVQERIRREERRKEVGGQTKEGEEGGSGEGGRMRQEG